CPIAVAVQGSDPLEGHVLLVEGDPYLPRVGAEHVVVEREHVPRPSTPGRMNPEGAGATRWLRGHPLEGQHEDTAQGQLIQAGEARLDCCRGVVVCARPEEAI